MQENVVTLSLKEEGVEYKMYLPFKETDYIQKIINATKQPYEYEMLQAMLKRLQKGSVVLDVGMNIANHSLFFAANGYKVIAFEANPKMSAIAKKSIQLNKFEKAIKVYEMGVSNCEEVAHFANEIPHNFGAMSLTQGESCGGGGIICKPLDALNLKEKITAMKIDVEGMEHKVLEGARKLIAKNRPLIYAEALFVQDFVRVERILEGMEYVCWDTFGVSPTHLFLPLESVSEKQIAAKNAAKLALVQLHHSGEKQASFTNLAFDAIYKEIVELKQNLK
ncbi:FkbM family methyltransferase [Helicobacter sp.]|uniref:FkbM family methyltransferase n=1 Tax=Helicobacter sp. TaxID=218 RepID=UPI0025BA7EC8|nr:FkbM family methyltransferase [Helicobacter sp.]MCI5968529.1 FkbM family methyltransferase [Helicobacter sp.]MDY2584738.1 FkbM family methyltransferase [Helicobacter sp.]